jgi:tripartite-type tricarboxylate transporter receptor subunit TctC
VPVSPGGQIDSISRLVGGRMADKLGQTVIVENRDGAGSMVGTRFVKSQPADGYTLFSTATSFVINKALNPALRYDPIRQFSPLALIATGDMGLVVHPSLPVQNVADLIKLARSKPGGLTYASPGNGTPMHLAMELFKQEAGVDLLHVPYKDQGGALTDLMAGRTDAMMTVIFTVQNQIRSGKMRLVGTLTSERSGTTPTTPTLREQGVPGVNVQVWYALVAPAGLPSTVQSRLNESINAALQRKDIREVFENQGLVPAGGSPERLGEWMRNELARWQKVVSSAGIKPD